MTDPLRHEDEYDALARQLHESIEGGQSVALTAKALRILAAQPSPSEPEFYDDGQRIMPDDVPPSPSEPDVKRAPCAHGNPCHESMCVEYGRWSPSPSEPNRCVCGRRVCEFRFTEHAAPDWPTLANIIREVDGNHDLGAGELAQRIIEHPRFRSPSPSEPDHEPCCWRENPHRAIPTITDRPRIVRHWFDEAEAFPARASSSRSTRSGAAPTTTKRKPDTSSSPRSARRPKPTAPAPTTSSDGSKPT